MIKLPISVVILAEKNDELLQQAIASVPWANEILLLWNSSEKNPVFQLNDQAHQILPHPGKITDFAKLRNAAFSAAKNEWLFFLDRDERVVAGAEEVIKKILDTPDLAAASIRRIDVFHGHQMRWGEVGNVVIMRFVKKGHGQFIRPVHEVLEATGPVVHSGIVLEHFAHQSLGSFWQKISSYVELELTLREKKSEKISASTWWLWPVGKFFHNYFLRLGILDGFPGLTYAIVMSVHSAALRIRLLERQGTHA